MVFSRLSALIENWCVWWDFRLSGKVIGDKMEMAEGGHIWLSPYIKEVLLQSMGNAGREGSMTTKGKDNHSLVEKKAAAKEGRPDYLVFWQKPTTDHQLRGFKRPLAQLPSPSLEIPAARTS